MPLADTYGKVGALKNKIFNFFSFKTIQGRLRISVFLSIIFHLIFLQTTFDSPNPLEKKPIAKKFLVNLKKETPKVRKIEDSKNKKQIVNTENLEKNIKPKDPKYLSEKDNTFERQTKASIVDTFKTAGQGQKNAQDNKSAKMKKKSLPKKLSLSDLMVAKNDTTEIMKEMKMKKGLKNGDVNKSGLAQNNDYLEDVKLGDFTNLNTVEFKYYGFYHRIRQQLEQHWGNSIREKAQVLFKRGRSIASADNITSLRVILDHKGNIVKIIVKATSGIGELDEAAVESFNKAGPFPNPPKGMMVNGQAIIEWGFVVKS